MNTTLSTPVDEQHHTHPPSLDRVSSARTVSLADRVALHLGVALITWSRRPRTTANNSGDALRARRQTAIARAKREREWQLALYLSQVRR